MSLADATRSPARVAALAQQIAATATRPWVLMEVCGGQTHAILRHGLDQLLPPGIELVHGPGCPVCVTPIEILDHAIALAESRGVTLATYGDMLRVPGSREDLYAARARGADVRVVHSPLDAVAMAAREPARQVVFLAVGFETTAPAHALAVLRARELGLENFSLLVAHVLVPPAIEAIAADARSRVQGFLAAGHVCAVMGTAAYTPLAARLGVPIVVTGFEPVDILDGVLALVTMLEDGRVGVENAYARVVRVEGNPAAQSMMERVFEPCAQTWRGVGEIPVSGLRLRDELARFDAARRFPGPPRPALVRPSPCVAGDVLRGLVKPDACPEFGKACTPSTPLGAPMVSTEGACAAYFRHRPPRAANV